MHKTCLTSSLAYRERKKEEIYFACQEFCTLFQIMFNQGYPNNSSIIFNFSLTSITKGTPLAHWANCWPTNLAVLCLRPTWGKVFSTVQTEFHCIQPYIILTWLKNCWKGYKIASHPSNDPLPQKLMPHHIIVYYNWTEYYIRYINLNCKSIYSIFSFYSFEYKIEWKTRFK